ncbi:PREDICTED: solute carrier family 22 member 6-B-like, partial [Merops nubicus]|uniref:solute carrier family 22 member 6-B-like n=1 Tax=Merops nubicus TaxID=57421 RepID=UPI0004F0944D
MTFVELLARLGGMGRFQVTYVAALALPLLMLASHNLLQNFTAGVPDHHCRPGPALANATSGEVPGSTDRGVATEPCRDGWVYHHDVFTHTIITEWDLVCESKRLRQVAQSIYMAGILVGSGLIGVLSDKW